ncbi:MAG TPA: hypothetical protein VIK91_23745, partial [Nannocystis sp.]
MPVPGPALAPARRAASRRGGDRLLALALALAALPACDGSSGQVELNWTVVDAAGRAVFPSGELSHLCDFTGRTVPEGERRPYSLQAQLRLCEPDCPGSCAAEPSCRVETLRYPCTSARGFSTVPARDDPYSFEVALVADLGDGCVCELAPACALVPGPRTRRVEPGLVTDLQVYLFVLTGLDLAKESLDDEGRTIMD